MVLHVSNVLNGEQVARCREVITQSKWVDGRITAGHQSALVKNNLQLPEESTEARELGDMIIAADHRHPIPHPH
jgi:PKHD-type hydroxylase